MGTAACYIYAAKAPVLLLAAIALTLVRMGLYILNGLTATGRLTDRPVAAAAGILPEGCSDLILVVAIAASGLCEPAWGLLALGSVLLAYFATMLGKAVGLDRPELGPPGAAGRLTGVIFFSLLHFLYVRNGWGCWTLSGLLVNPLGWGMMTVTVVAQMTALDRAREALRRIICLQEIMTASCPRWPEGGQVRGRAPHGWLVPR